MLLVKVPGIHVALDSHVNNFENFTAQKLRCRLRGDAEMRGALLAKTKIDEVQMMDLGSSF